MSRIPTETRDALRAALAGAVESIFERQGATFLGRGRHRRTRVCPLRPEPHNGFDVNVNVESGLWDCHACGDGGDVFDAVARFANLDAVRDFPEVARLGAELVGFDLEEPADQAEADRRRAAFRRAQEAREAARREREAQEARELAKAEADAARWWPQFATAHPRGLAYLAGRGIEPTPLWSSFLRFASAGDPAVPLHNEAGQVVNVVRRLIVPPPDWTHTPGLPICKNRGTLVGRLTDIERGSLVIVCEGVVDSLTAVLAWPGAVVLGAHSANQYGNVVAMACQRLAAVGTGRLLMVFDNDEAGFKAMEKGTEAAIVSDFPVSFTDVVEVAPHKDLNEAWCAGWRP